MFRRVIPITLVVTLLVGAGVLAGRAWFPRHVVQQVDHEVLKVVEKLVPGQTVTIVKEVLGPERRVEVPVVVEKLVPVPGDERVVTVTKPVEVPVEVVRERWPQTLTVRVGGVLTDEHGWVQPSRPDLLIGQVAPGIYAVSAQMEGWRIDSVRTETKITAPAPPRWHVELRPAAGVISLGQTVALGAGAQLQASRGHLVFELTAGQSTAGPFGFAILSYRF